VSNVVVRKVIGRL